MLEMHLFVPSHASRSLGNSMSELLCWSHGSYQPVRSTAALALQ
jgi:hypothetical protein